MSEDMESYIKKLESRIEKYTPEQQIAIYDELINDLKKQDS